jgi:Uma2 family endonuclease
MQSSTSTTFRSSITDEIIYPESDGNPMAENTQQFHLITTLQGGIDTMFAERDDILCAGDLFWYPVQGSPNIRLAPDIMVVFGRPRGDRSSYMQWMEDGIAPQVVMEIISPSNDPAEMMDKLEFYDTYGVEEYYTYNPLKLKFNAWQRQNGHLQYLYEQSSWQSPRLGITFSVEPENAKNSTYGLAITRRDGTRFERFMEVYAELRKEKQRAEQEKQRAEQEKQRAEQEKQRAEQEKQRAERLLAQLLSAGITPEESIRDEL